MAGLKSDAYVPGDADLVVGLYSRYFTFTWPHRALIFHMPKTARTALWGWIKPTGFVKTLQLSRSTIIFNVYIRPHYYEPKSFDYITS